MKARTLIFTAVAMKALHSASAEAPAGAGVFQRFDKNGDGKVRPDELLNKQTFDRFDVNKDGVITLEEYTRVAGGMARKPGATPGPTNAPAAPPSSTPTAGAGDKGRAEQLFKFFDKNGDGVLTVD